MAAVPGLLLIFGCLGAGLVSASKLSGGADPAHRALWGMLIGCWLVVVVVYGLLALGIFWPITVASVGLALSLSAWWLAAGAAREVLSYLAKEAGSWSLLAKVVSGLTATMVVLTSARMVGQPPHGWDAVAYHLVHAGRWVRDGTFTREIHPDGWSFYEFYPTGGDTLWALMMLGDGSTQAIYPGILLGHALAAAGVYALMRCGGLQGSLAALGTAAVLSTSPVYLSASWLYVDGVALGLCCGVAAAALIAAHRPSVASMLAVGAGVACAITVKSNLIVLVLLVVVLLARLWPTDRRLALSLALLAPLVLVVPEWASRLVEFGNPLYPMGLPILGKGDPLLAAMMDGTLFRDKPGLEDGLSVRQVAGSLLLISTPLGPPVLSSSLPALLPLGLLAAVGGAMLVRTHRVLVVVLAVVFLCSFALVLSPTSWALIVVWVDTGARLLLPGWAVVVLLAARALRASWAGALLAGLAIGGILLELSAETPSVVALLCAGAVTGLLAALLATSARSVPVLWLAVVALIGGASLVVPRLAGQDRPTAPPRHHALAYLLDYAPAREHLADHNPALIATDFDFEDRKSVV